MLASNPSAGATHPREHPFLIVAFLLLAVAPMSAATGGSIAGTVVDPNSFTGVLCLRLTSHYIGASTGHTGEREFASPSDWGLSQRQLTAHFGGT